MAQLRLIALALCLAPIACRAEAGPTSGITPPIGWRAMPEIAAAAANAANTEHVTVAGAQAWGEPAMGCYGVWLAMAGPSGAPDVLAARAVESFRGEPGLTISNVGKPVEGADHGVLTLSFKRAGYDGRARARIDRDGHVVALACFWNEREPGACEAACFGLLEKLP